MDKQGGREAYQEEVASRHSGAGRFPLLQQKNPRMPAACLGSGRMVSGSLLQLIVQEVVSVSAPFPIIKGFFNTHISCMGIANMIKNAIVMSTSPVNRVNTKRGDT